MSSIERSNSFLERYPNNKIGNFFLEKAIGEGTFGKVYLGLHIPTKERVAIKILEKDKIKEGDSIERVNREINLLINLKNENIIELFEKYEDDTTIFLFMEYAEDGELFNYIVEKTRLDEKEAAYFFVQIINGIEYIHQNEIAHRDLKPENILINENKILKIIDFGLSNSYKNNKLLETPCGSPCYAAPEMLLGHKYNGLKIDIWSIGIILYAMVHGFLPFEDDNNVVLYKKILECKLDFPFDLSQECFDMIKRLLTVNPDKRIQLNEIKNHHFYKIGLKILQKKDFNIDKEAISKMVFEKMNNSGFDIEEIYNSLKNQEKNNITTTFFLIYNRLKSKSYQNKMKMKKSKSVNNQRPLDEIQPTFELFNDKRNEFDNKIQKTNKDRNPRDLQINQKDNSKDALVNKRDAKSEINRQCINLKIKKNEQNVNDYSVKNDTQESNRKKTNSLVPLYTQSGKNKDKQIDLGSKLFNKSIKNTDSKQISNFKKETSFNSILTKNNSSKQKKQVISVIPQNFTKDNLETFNTKIAPFSTKSNSGLLANDKLLTNHILTSNSNSNRIIEKLGNVKIEKKRDSSKSNSNNFNNIIPFNIEEKIPGKNLTGKNFKLVLKDYKLKNINITKLMTKESSRKKLEDSNLILQANNSDKKENENDSAINKFKKKSCTSPTEISFPMNMSKVPQNKLNYPLQNIITNNREQSKEKMKKTDIFSLRQGFVPETINSPIKIFCSPQNEPSKNLSNLKNQKVQKYSSLTNKLDSILRVETPSNKSKSGQNNEKQKKIFNCGKEQTLNLISKESPIQKIRENLNINININVNNNNFVDSNKIKSSSVKERKKLSRFESLKDKIKLLFKKNDVEIEELNNPSVFECKKNNSKFKIELNMKNIENPEKNANIFNLVHLQGHEEISKEILKKLMNLLE